MVRYFSLCPSASKRLSTGNATMDTCPMKASTKFVSEKDRHYDPIRGH